MDPKELEYYRKGVQRQMDMEDSRNLRIVNILRSAHSERKVEPLTLEDLRSSKNKRSKDEVREAVKNYKSLADRVYGNKNGAD